VGDTATDKDSIGFEPYVQAVAEFLWDPRTEPPLTISVEGEWGAGKGRGLYPKGRRKRWLHRKPFRPFGYRLLNEAVGRHTVCSNT